MLALKIKHKTALPSERLILLHIKRCDSCSVFLQSSAALHHADVLQDVLRILIVVLMATYSLEVLDGPPACSMGSASACGMRANKRRHARSFASSCKKVDESCAVGHFPTTAETSFCSLTAVASLREVWRVCCREWQFMTASQPQDLLIQRSLRHSDLKIACAGGCNREARLGVWS
jgi:hypothetical protein